MVTKLLYGAYVIMWMVPRSFRHTAYLLAFLASTCVHARAQTTQYEGRIIANIQFVPSQQPLSPAQINDILPVRRKETLQMEQVREAIRRLYATGRYTDISVDAEPYGNEVILRFYTKNAWFIGRVSVEGDINEPPNPGQLVNAAGLELGRPFMEDMLPDAEQRIRRLLETNGYYEAVVSPEVNYDDQYEQVRINFRIEPGPRARYARPAVTGELKMPEEKVVEAANWKRWIIGTWKPVTQTRTRRGVDDVREEYQEDERLMARVRLEGIEYDSDSRRARPSLRIDAGPKVEVRTIGDDLSQSTLRKYLPIFEERTIDRDLLVEGARNLRDYYQSEGYFEAEVEFKESRVVNDRAVIDYLINKGRRYKLVRVAVQGHRYFDEETIRERMFLAEASLLQFRRGRYSGSLRERDEDSIANLYRANGFRDVVVDSRTENDYQGKLGDLAVFITIKEGPQSFVQSLQVDGIKQLDQDEIVSRLSSIEGQPFSEFNVAVDRDTILNYYFANGFPDASFTWSMTPADEPNRMHLRFVITEGTQQFVRQVLVSGLETTRPGLVNRNLLLNPGQPLSPIEVSDTQRRLYDLGVFAKVDMAIQNPEGATTRKYVVYQIEEARKYSITSGFGAEIARIGGSRTGTAPPSGGTGFAPRVSLDVTRFNFLGLGHSLGFRSRLSTLQRQGFINYSAPRFRNVEGRNLTLTLLYDDSRYINTFSARRQEASVQLSQRLSKPTTALFRFSYRRVSVSDVRINPLLVPLFSQPVRIGMLSGNIIQDRRDDPVDARKGIYNTADFGLASRYFGSQRSFGRLLGRNATYHPLTRSLTLARETSLGALLPFRIAAEQEGADPAQAIPFPERLFGGGGTSHRGFNENQAGPRDLQTGFPLGANALLFNKTELRFPLLGENIGGVLFHDAGNVYSRFSDITFRQSQRDLEDFNYMVHAVGFGIRYRTPIGPIRFDLAYSINPPAFTGCKGSYEEMLECSGPNPPANNAPSRQQISHLQFFFSIGQTF